jgi:pyridoxamine 5'-phosphate oxidase-like protein
MTDRQPTQTTNLDIYGDAVLPWSRPRDALANLPLSANTTWFLGTAGTDGRPHAAGVGALWDEGDIYFVSGPGTRKSKHLAANPACSISVQLPGLDLVFEGTADRVTDNPTLERLASKYREGGWEPTVDGDAFTAPYSAPSAGPPPWHVYRFTIDTVFGVAGAEPHGATRWRFD